MLVFGTVASIISQASTTVKTVLTVAGLVAALSAAYVTGQAVIAMPSKLAKHDSVTIAESHTLDKILCIDVADHRKMNWNLCYINPSEVMPVDGTNGTH